MMWIPLTNYLLHVNKMGKIFESPKGNFLIVEGTSFRSWSFFWGLLKVITNGRNKKTTLDSWECFEGAREATSKGYASMTLDLGVVIVGIPNDFLVWEQLWPFFFSKGLSLTLRHLQDPYLNTKRENA